MRILISNDDGLFSNGLQHLEAELSSIAEVWAIAPDRERSATSQALSIRETLLLKQERERHYTVSGFPTDCVNVALFGDMFPDFDLVVSGINHGVNMGDDVHYSGTVGAARHGAVHGIRSVAISSPLRGPENDYRRVARWFADWIQENYQHLTPRIVYNINYPEESERLELSAPYPEVHFTSLGRRVYMDGYRILEDGTAGTVLKLKESVLGSIKEEGSDFLAFQSGFISITPLSLDSTSREEISLWTSSKVF